MNLALTPIRQKPTQSQQNNARAKAKWPLLKHYFADFEQVFAGWALQWLVFCKSAVKYSSPFKVRILLPYITCF